MKSISLLLLLASSTAFGQYQFSNPIELTGTEEGARTIHFTNDGSAIYGDWDELTQWNLRSNPLLTRKKLRDTIPIKVHSMATEFGSMET